MPRVKKSIVSTIENTPVLETLSVSDQARTSGYEDRPYQQQAVKRTVGYLAKGIPSVIIESPTGSGKTVMGLMICAEMIRRGAKKIVWVAMRRELLTQAEVENRTRGFNLDIIYVSMFQTADLPQDVDFLVLDEAHHDSCDTMTTLHKTLAPKQFIGLSATPYRTDRVGLCFAKVVKEAGIFQLVREGYLSAFDHYSMPRYTPQSVAETYLRDRAAWGKSIMFFHRKEQCEKAASLLTARGVSVEVVTGESDRASQIARFESGDVGVLINCMVLTEGFDCPSLQTVFVRPSAKGSTMQMAGRVLRKYQGMRKKIVQCQVTKNPFTALAPASDQYVWDGDVNSWLAVKPDERIDAAWAEMQKAIAAAVVDEEALAILGGYTPPKQINENGEVSDVTAADREVTPRTRGRGRGRRSAAEVSGIVGADGSFQETRGRGRRGRARAA